MEKTLAMMMLEEWQVTEGRFRQFLKNNNQPKSPHYALVCENDIGN